MKRILRWLRVFRQSCRDNNENKQLADDECEEVGVLEPSSSPIRKIKHFFMSGSITIGIDHFLAMFPSTILVPLIINNRFGMEVIDPSLVLLTSGIGTLIFILITRGTIPAYLGSSFAYIGLTVYLITSISTPELSPLSVYVYIGWSYAFSAILLGLLSVVYRTKLMRRIINFIFPAAIIGPAISLIGLELSDTAAADSGLNTTTGIIDGNAALIAISTLIIIIIISVVRRRILKNASILIGMLGGCILSTLVYGADFSVLADAALFSVPNVNIPFTILPPNLLLLFLSIIPATLVIFTENISRITVIERMRNPNKHSNKLFDMETDNMIHKSLLGQSVTIFVSALLGSVPSTIYAENIAVMSINNTDIRGSKAILRDKNISSYYDNFTVIPYVIAALLAIMTSFLGILQDLLAMIPKSVIGGMELFLFGIIAAPGIQLLVEQKVNYHKISNQILTASVLVAGISGFTINLGILELKGMGLGLFIGIAVNILFKFVERLGRLNERLSFSELLSLCLSDPYSQNDIMLITVYPFCSSTDKPQSEADCESMNLTQSMITLQDELVKMQPQVIRRIIDGDMWGAKQNDISYATVYDINPEMLHNYIEMSDYAQIGMRDSKEIIITIKETPNRLLMSLKLSPEKALMLAADYGDTIDEDKENIGMIDVTINGQISKHRLQEIIHEAYRRYIVKRSQT